MGAGRGGVGRGRPRWGPGLLRGVPVPPPRSPHAGHGEPPAGQPRRHVHGRDPPQGQEPRHGDHPDHDGIPAHRLRDRPDHAHQRLHLRLRHRRDPLPGRRVVHHLRLPLHRCREEPHGMRGEGQPDHERHQRHLRAPGNRGLHRGPQPQRALPLQLQLLQLSRPARRERDFHRAAHLHHPGILHRRGHRQFLVPGHAPQLQRGHADRPQCHPGGSGRATGGAASASQLQRAGCSRSLTPRTSEWDPASIAPKSQGYGILLLLCCRPGCAGPPPKSQGHPQIPLSLCPWACSEGLHLLAAVGRGFSRGESWAIPACQSLVGCWGSLASGFRNSRGSGGLE